jgi:hypothetical protein
MCWSFTALSCCTSLMALTKFLLPQDSGCRVRETSLATRHESSHVARRAS